jgi:hypothetical protein
MGDIVEIIKITNDKILTASFASFPFAQHTNAQYTGTGLNSNIKFITDLR